MSQGPFADLPGFEPWVDGDVDPFNPEHIDVCPGCGNEGNFPAITDNPDGSVTITEQPCSTCHPVAPAPCPAQASCVVCQHGQGKPEVCPVPAYLAHLRGDR